MRVILTAHDGSNVEIRVPGPYILDDMAARAAALITPLPRTATPIPAAHTAPATTKAAHRGQQST